MAPVSLAGAINDFTPPEGRFLRREGSEVPVFTLLFVYSHMIRSNGHDFFRCFPGAGALCGGVCGFFWGAMVPFAAVAESGAPSHLARTGVEAFLPYSIGNVRGLDAGRILGTYRWNGLPVLGQAREASVSTERFDVYAGLAALEGGEVLPGGVVERWDKTVAAGEGARFVLLGGLASRSMASVEVDGSFGTPALGLRLNVRDERGETALPGLRYAGSYAGITATAVPAPDVKLTASLEMDHSRERGEQAAVYLNGLPAPVAPRAGTLFGQTWDGSEFRDRVAALRLNWKIAPDWTVSSGLLRMDLRGRDADFEGVLQPGGRYQLFYLLDAVQRFVSDTAHLQADARVHAFGMAHRLQFGASRLTYRFMSSGTTVNTLGLSSLDIPAALAPVAPGPELPQFEAERQTDTGWFFRDTLEFGERWKMLVGVRGGLFRQTGANVQAPAVERYTLGSLGLRFAWTPALTVYATRGEALERGGTAPISATNALRVLPAFRSRQLEAGLRYAVTARLSVEGALFEARRRYEYENAAGAFRQDGTVHHRGAELRAVGRLGGVSLYANFLALDPRVRGASDPAVDGADAIDVPAQRAKLIAESPLPWAGWSVHANLSAVSRRAANAPNTANIPGYAVFGAGVAYATRLRGRGLQLRLDIDNLADRGYWESVSGGYLWQGDPRVLHARIMLDV